jgi:oxalyl-CoA decarboxylase
MAKCGNRLLGFTAAVLAAAQLAQLAYGQGRRAQTTTPEPQTPAARGARGGVAGPGPAVGGAEVDETPVITRHSIQVQGKTLNYTATAAQMPLKDASGETEAHIFYMAYTLDGDTGAAKRPLIVLGKGAAYAQADADIRALVEKTGIPYLPMSMAKGLLPDTHEQCASAARSFVLPGADVVMLIGARLNWLLSHGKGKTWGGKGHKDWGGQKFIQIDISPQEADSNVRIDAPVVGDIGSCVSALLNEMKSSWAKPPAEWTNAVGEKKTTNVAKMGETLAKNPSPMNFHSALNVVRDIVKANPEAMLVNEGANALDFTRSIVDMYKPRKRIDVGTWGIMGVGMGYCVAAAVVTRQQVIAIEGDSAFGFSGMEVETLCRYNLPVCIVIMNNNGVYKGTDVDPTGKDPAPTVFVKGARYDKLMEAFGGVGVNATTPAELRKAMEDAIRSKKPTLINAVIDETAGTESGRITSLNPTAGKKK